VNIRVKAAAVLAVPLVAGLCLNAATPAGASVAKPDARAAATYLVGQLIGGTHYEATYTCTADDASWGCVPAGSVQDYGPDYGLTIDAGFELIAAGAHAPEVGTITNWLAGEVTNYTSIGTPTASPGALAKLALFAEATGKNPHTFGGSDLIAALDTLVCADATSPCAGAGAFKTQYASTLIQSLGVIAQLRANDKSHAATTIKYLESSQLASSGGWPGSLPATVSSVATVDSTAFAVMALNLVDTKASNTARAHGLKWLASQQAASGGFPGDSPDSANSTGLAIQALSLSPLTYAKQIAAAEAFLAKQQNADGGININPTTPGSDVRATTQSAGGATGISFATLGHTLMSTLNVTVKPAKIHPKTHATLTITVTATGATVDGAKLSASAAGVKLASGTVSNGKVVITLPKLKKGKHTITLKYAGTTSAKPASIKKVLTVK
jgi:hypothetical protein